MNSNFPHTRLSDFDYELPKNRIPEFPLSDRASSRLLVVDCVSDEISDRNFFELPGILPLNSHLVINSTKVIAARILMQKVTGGKAELLITDPLAPSSDPVLVMSSKGKCSWKAIIGGRNIKIGDKLNSVFENDELKLSAEILEKNENIVSAELSWQPEQLSFAEILNNIGKIPLPPYIKRDTTDEDKSRYQTVYADSPGSVAAPTAGLHFTPEIISQLRKMEIGFTELILHVGPGTFQPVDDENVGNHKMHSEQFFVHVNAIEELIEAENAGKTVISVGTTSLRTLESLYWIGVKILNGIIKIGDELILETNEPYELATNNLPDSKLSYQAILNFAKKSGLEFLSGHTSLFIVPGYKIRTADAIITNFHLPKSTLVMLISAFLNEIPWRKIYAHALANEYRFLSYGDSSILLNPRQALHPME